MRNKEYNESLNFHKLVYHSKRVNEKSLTFEQRDKAETQCIKILKLMQENSDEATFTFAYSTYEHYSNLFCKGEIT